MSFVMMFMDLEDCWTICRSYETRNAEMLNTGRRLALCLIFPALNKKLLSAL